MNQDGEYLTRDEAEIISQLMQRGWSIVVKDEGGYDGFSYVLNGPHNLYVHHDLVRKLQACGWIERTPSGMAFIISPDGIGSYHRAVEFGGGKLPVKP